MKFNFEDFSERVKRSLPKSDYKGLSLRKLSKEWGLSAPTLSRAFSGKRSDIDTVITICFFLDIELTDYII